MKSSKEKLLDNDWYLYGEDREDIYFGKHIYGEFVSCYLRKSTSEILCIDAGGKCLEPDFIKELNKELEKLEVK